MKKLALALVCFASVAFFASCNPEITNPEPTISVITDAGFVENGDVVDLNQVFVYGFQMASNSQTKKELKQLSIASYFVDLDGEEYLQEEEIIPLTGKTEYRFIDTIAYEITRELVGSIKSVATVTDVDGKINTATLTLKLNEPTQPLIASPIEWVKIGHNVQNLSEYGLVWEETNYKDPFTHIFPAEGCMLFACSGYGDDFDEINTDVDLARYFNDLAEMTVIPTEINTVEYNKVDCNPANKDYNDLLITKDAEGKLHAILIQHATVTSVSAGTQITITGLAK